MKMTVLMISAVVLGLAGCSKKSEEPTVSSSVSANVLSEGNYSAGIKPFVCSGCGSFMGKAMRSVFGVEKAAADDKSHTLKFTVAKGASVSEKDVQDALKAAADKMGMGADYTLSNIAKSN